MLSDGYDLLAMTSEERTRLMSLPTGAMKIVRQNATVVICTECKKPGTLQDTMLCSKACEAGFGKIRQIDTTFQCKIAIYCSREVCLIYRHISWHKLSVLRLLYIC